MPLEKLSTQLCKCTSRFWRLIQASLVLRILLLLGVLGLLDSGCQDLTLVSLQISRLCDAFRCSAQNITQEAGVLIVD